MPQVKNYWFHIQWIRIKKEKLQDFLTCIQGYKWNEVNLLQSPKTAGFKWYGQGGRKGRTSGAPSRSVLEEAKKADVETGEPERILKQGQSVNEGQRKLK